MSIRPLKKLSVRHQNVIGDLVSGRFSEQEIRQAYRLDRNTLMNWQKDPLFRAEFEKQQMKLSTQQRERQTGLGPDGKVSTENNVSNILRQSATDALDVLMKSMKQRNKDGTVPKAAVDAAAQILRMSGAMSRGKTKEPGRTTVRISDKAMDMLINHWQKRNRLLRPPDPRLT